MKTVRALFVEASTRKIVEIAINPSLKEYYKKIGCELIENVSSVFQDIIDRDVVSIYVDENGSWAIENMWTINGYQTKQWIFGNAVIVGCDPESGDDTPSKITLEWMQKNVLFADRQTASAYMQMIK